MMAQTVAMLVMPVGGLLMGLGFAWYALRSARRDDEREEASKANDAAHP